MKRVFVPLMSRFSALLLIGVFALITTTGIPAAHATASPTITVVPWSAPNAFGSPNAAAAFANATYAMEHGLSSYGTLGTPAYFEAITGPISVTDNIVSGFPSWKGYADPGTVFGPAFASELGNRLHFALDILGNGTLISIDQLSFTMSSTDPYNYLGFSFATGSYGYSSSYYGIQYGPDLVKGGGDDIYIVAGPASTKVNEIVGRGSGNAAPVYLTDPGATPQDKINNIAAILTSDLGSYTVTGEYTLTLDGGYTVVGSGDADVVAAPEPSTYAAVAFIVVIGFTTFMKRRSKKA